MTGWATEKELELARDIAEQGLKLLMEITNHLKLYDYSIKDGIIKYYVGKEAREYQSNKLHEKIMPRINTLCNYATWGDTPNLSIRSAVRTIERSWQGNCVRPFVNCDEDIYGFYPTAHQACIDWVKGYKNMFDSEDDRDIESNLLFAGEVFEINESKYADLSLQIVAEWREGLNWISQNNSTDRLLTDDPKERTLGVHPVPKKPADGRQLTEDLDFIHKSLERLIEESTSNIRTIRTVELLDCRKVPGFCLACRRLAMFAIHNRLESEANILIRLTRRGQEYYGELVESDDCGPMCFEIINEVQVMLEELDIAILPHAPEIESDATETLIKWENRILKLNGKEIAKYKPAAKNQIAILDAFEEEGWPKRIDDPLVPTQTDPGAKLRETIRGLNDKQGFIEFKADGESQGVEWELHVSSMGANTEITPTEDT